MLINKHLRKGACEGCEREEGRGGGPEMGVREIGVREGGGGGGGGVYGV